MDAFGGINNLSDSFQLGLGATFGLIFAIAFGIAFLLKTLKMVFYYRKILPASDVFRIQDQFHTHFSSEMKAQWVQWQSQTLTIHEYHLRAVKALQYFERCEKEYLTTLDVQRQWAQRNGASQLHEQRRLQKTLPKTSQMQFKKRI